MWLWWTWPWIWWRRRWETGPAISPSTSTTTTGNSRLIWVIAYTSRGKNPSLWGQRVRWVNSGSGLPDSGAVVVNADTWNPEGLGDLVDDWDGERIRVMVAGGGTTLMPDSPVVASLLPATACAVLAAAPSGLYEVCWLPAAQRGALEVIPHRGTVVDCGTPAEYLRANLLASGGMSVVGAGARVEGSVERSVIWPGAVVHAGEYLCDAIRIGPRQTVLVR